MILEIPAIFVGVFGHRDREQHLDVEAGQPRVEQRHLPSNEATFLEVTDATPAGRARHASDVGQFGLVARRITLQCIQQATISFGQFHLRILSVILYFLNYLFQLFRFHSE